MEYKGRKVGFKRTVGAMAELTKLAPGGDVNRFGEIFSTENLGASLEGGAQFLAILNKWYEKSLVFEIDGYRADPIPMDWFLILESDDFNDLLGEAMKQFLEDDKATVEATELKGKKKEQAVTTK